MAYNNVEYNKEYNKNHYKSISAQIKPEDYAAIDDFCKEMKISKRNFIVSAARYIIDNNIPVSEFLKE